MSVLKETKKKFRYLPGGVMTEKEWVEKFADRFEMKIVDWQTLINKKKWNGLEGIEQEAYEESLKKKTKIYRAWHGDIFQEISKSTYLWAIEKLKGK